MPLSALPNEILCLVPLFVNNIETFINAAATCRRLRDAFLQTHPNTILRLADASAPTFFSPHPHFLVAATARQASDWALGNEERTQQLREALRNGIDGLYDFCLQHSGLTLARIRQIYLARFSTINPMSDKIDKMAGDQWYSTPNFWDGGVSEPYTIFTEADRATFQIIIYGELFGRSMEAFLEPQRNLPFFDIPVRLDYWTYCVPDSGCRSYVGYEVLPVGPYAKGNKTMKDKDQFAMRYILHCGRWRRMWAAAFRPALRDDFKDEDENEEYWKKKMFRNAMQTQGLEGMQLITLPVEQVSQRYIEKVRRTKSQIVMLTESPVVENLGSAGDTPVSRAPDPGMEVQVSIRSMWPCRR